MFCPAALRSVGGEGSPRRSNLGQHFCVPSFSHTAGFDTAKAEGLYWKVRAGSGVLLLPRRWSVFVRHIVPFFLGERGHLVGRIREQQLF